MKIEIKMAIRRKRTRFELLTVRPYVGGYKWKLRAVRLLDIFSNILYFALCKYVDIKYRVIFTICGLTDPAVARTSI